MNRFQTITQLIESISTLQELLHILPTIHHRPSHNLTPRFPDSSLLPPFHPPSNQLLSFAPFALKQLATIQGHILGQLGKTDSNLLLSRYQDFLPHLESKLENDYHLRSFLFDLFQDITYWQQQCISSLKRNGLEISQLLDQLADDSLYNKSYHLSIQQCKLWIQSLSSHPSLDSTIPLTDLFTQYRNVFDSFRKMGVQLHEQYYALLSLRRLTSAKSSYLPEKN